MLQCPWRNSMILSILLLEDTHPQGAIKVPCLESKLFENYWGKWLRRNEKCDFINSVIVFGS
eukprot:m.160816 g.160816  ORF g.160816 m.160816 type:complete len:62 (-) comp15175_c2_seq1:1623-1808(-)